MHTRKPSEKNKVGWERKAVGGQNEESTKSFFSFVLQMQPGVQLNKASESLATQQKAKPAHSCPDVNDLLKDRRCQHTPLRPVSSSGDIFHFLGNDFMIITPQIQTRTHSNVCSNAPFIDLGADFPQAAVHPSVQASSDEVVVLFQIHVCAHSAQCL